MLFTPQANFRFNVSKWYATIQIFLLLGQQFWTNLTNNSTAYRNNFSTLVGRDLSFNAISHLPKDVFANLTNLDTL